LEKFEGVEQQLKVVRYRGGCIAVEDEWSIYMQIQSMNY
jgi:hypothetical protein